MAAATTKEDEMNALRNLMHMAVLAIWALMGSSLTLKALFGAGASLPSFWMAASWWIWFAGLAALTTWLVARWKSAVAALAVHAAVLLVLMALPRYLPFSLL